MVELWASWCPPCVPKLCVLDRVAADYSDRGVTVLAIATDEERRRVDNALEGFEPTFVLGWAPDGRTQADVHSVRTTFVLDADGVVRHQTSACHQAGVRHF